MITSNLKKILCGLGLGLFFLQGTFFSACSEWTEIEAKDYFEPVTEGYKNNLKDYFNSPHKVMFGWFGNWTASSMPNSLCGLPDSVDFVSLWLCWGNLNEAQQTDLKKFQKRGSKAILCWRAGDIGDNLTPGGNDAENKKAFWGMVDGDEDSYLQAAKKYALAIVDTVNKYNVDGFDYDIEDWGTLMSQSNPQRAHVFMQTLREEFNKTGKMLVADIPGGTAWLRFYNALSAEVVEGLDYIVWQTYELDHSGLDAFFNGSGGVRSYHPELFEKVVKKSIVTATFERAADKPLFSRHQTYHPSFGVEHAGMGAYHIEYDYAGNPDYPFVRAAIAAQNPPINH